MRQFSIFVYAILCLSSGAADWPCWRGPDGLGVSSEKNLPVQWSRDKHIVWKVEIPGKGASSPVVVGKKVYVSTQTEDTGLHLYAIDAKWGQVLWESEIGQGKLPANNLHNMATPTPVADGRHVWVMFGTGDLACVDNEAGKILWQRNLVKEYGTYHLNHGYGSSPMLLDGTLFVACMHQGPSYLLAIDAKSGKNIWKKDRNLEPKDEAQDSYSSPIFLRHSKQTQVVLAGAESLTAYDPGSGEQIWTAGGMKVPHPYGRTIAGPTAGENMVIGVASGFQNRGYMVAFNPDGHGDVTTSHKLWTSEKYSPDCPTPVVYNGSLYSVRDDGNASCLDLKTGQPHWQERLFSANCKISPVAADGKVYFMNGQGNCYVVAASPKFELLATNELKEETLSTPAMSGGHIYIRTQGGIYSIGK